MEGKNKILKNEYFLSFFIAVLIAAVSFAATGVWPFGEYSAACSDMKLQYLEVMSGYLELIKRGSSPFIAFQGLGINLYASTGLVFIDPFNILFLFFDKRYFSDVYTLITILKFGLIALGMCFYLKKSNYARLDGKMCIAFSVLYAFGGFCMKCVINVMWLETVAMLPVLLIGIEQVIENRRFAMTFFALTYHIITSFYTGYMSCIFAVMYFIFYYAVQKNDAKPAEIVKSLGICALIVVFALGASSVTFLPYVKTITSGYVDKFDDNMVTSLWGWGLKDVAKFFTIIQNDGATAATLFGFFGTAAVYLTLLLLSEKSVPKRERIAAGIIMLVFILSFTLRPLFLVWHLFREPVGFFGRFSYTTGFALIMFSARFIGHYKTTNRLSTLLPAVISAALAVYGGINTNLWQECCAAIFCIFIIIYMPIISGGKKAAAACLILLEAALMCGAGIGIIKKYDTWGARSERIKLIDDAQALMSEINDDRFYRMTNVSSSNANAALGIGYNSLETFTSQTNQRSMEKLSELGLWCPYDYRISANYSNNTVAEGLFCVKYVMATDPANAVKYGDKTVHCDGGKTSAMRLLSDNYRLIKSSENGYIYENTHAFPLMFAAEESALNADKDFYSKDEVISGGFRNQEKFLNLLFGTDLKLYEDIMPEEQPPMNAVKTTTGGSDWDYFDIKLTNLAPGQTEALYDISQLGFIGYRFTPEKDGEYLIDARYSYLPSDGEEQKILYSVNGVPLLCQYTDKTDILANDIGPYKKGENVDITIQMRRDMRLVRPLILRLNDDAYDKFYSLANKNALENISESKGAITAKSSFDKDRLIFASLSYDEGFHIFIDGKETEKICIADAFLGYRVPAGQHDISIKYVPPGFYAGIGLSALFLAAALGIIFYFKKR